MLYALFLCALCFLSFINYKRLLEERNVKSMFLAYWVS